MEMRKISRRHPRSVDGPEEEGKEIYKNVITPVHSYCFAYYTTRTVPRSAKMFYTTKIMRNFNISLSEEEIIAN